MSANGSGVDTGSYAFLHVSEVRIRVSTAPLIPRLAPVPLDYRPSRLLAAVPFHQSFQAEADRVGSGGGDPFRDQSVDGRQETVVHPSHELRHAFGIADRNANGHPPPVTLWRSLHREIHHSIEHMFRYHGGCASWSGPTTASMSALTRRWTMDLGAWLVEQRSEMDRAEAGWLERLAEFDRDGLWALDGQLSCVTWLVWRARMARSTAFEKLRVAHELRRRPIIADALRRGELSYSIARALTRMDRPDPEVDRSIVAAVIDGQLGVADVEMLVRSFRLYGDQEQPPGDDPVLQRDVRIIRDHDGTGRVVITLDDTELEEFAATLQAFLDLRNRAVEESSGGDGTEAPLEQEPPGDKRAGAFMDMAHTALAHADGGRAAGDDRYLVHIIKTAQAVTHLDGRPLHPGDAAMIECDTSTVTHTLSPDGEPLHLGRRTREWSTAQRRAVAVRDGGHCRFVGCHNRIYDLHHLQPWEHGGPTDIDNACCQCRRHHRMIHHGYRAEGDPNHELRFYRPDGTYIGSTHPTTAQLTSRIRDMP